MISRGRLLALAAVVAAALALHARSLGFGFSYLDDDVLVLAEHQPGRTPPSPWQALGRSYFPAADRDHAYYRPLVSASLALDGALSGAKPWGYHATNVVLHAVSGALLFLLLTSLGYADGVALFGSLAFVLHPALAGAVCWIPGRDDLLLGMFGLLSWLSFRRARSEPSPARRALHALCFFLALACKEAAVVLPFVLVLDACVLGRQPWRAVLERWLLVAWGIPLVLYVGLRLAVLGSDLGVRGLVGGGAALGIGGLVSGLGALVLPRDPQILAVPADMRLLGGALALVFLGAVARSGEGRRAVVFALGAFLVLSAPSLPALSRLLLESRLYLPAVPLAVAACELARLTRLAPSMRVGLAGFVLVLLGQAAVRHGADFRDRLAFAEAARDGSPHSSLAHRNLGIAYQTRGDGSSARREYELALAADPSEPVVHNNLAVLLMAEGRLAEAERELRTELALHPGSSEAERNLELIRQARAGTPPFTR